MDLRCVYFLAVAGFAQADLVNLKCDGIKKFVKGHNSRRLRIAKGEVPGQPAASRMDSMVKHWAYIWDDELAEKAAEWASRNKYGHNPSRSIASKRFEVGENVYQYGTTDQYFSFDPEMALTTWFGEYIDFKYKKLDWGDTLKQPAIGHYTQMVWSDSVYLGCAISNYQDKGWNYFFTVCNYGPTGNYIRQTPYKSGNASGHLTCGAHDCSRMYGGSCGH